MITRNIVPCGLENKIDSDFLASSARYSNANEHRTLLASQKSQINKLKIFCYQIQTTNEMQQRINLVATTEFLGWTDVQFWCNETLVISATEHDNISNKRDKWKLYH